MIGTASAPGSSANLGPGFDVLGLALDLRCRAQVSDGDQWVVLSDGVDPGAEATELIIRAATELVGDDTPLRIEIDSDIPRGSGLGSSAAVIAATGAAAVRNAGIEIDALELFQMVAAVDGHPDNAAATVYGGLVAVVGGAVIPLDVNTALRAVVGLPAGELSTGAARRGLPTQIQHAAAARNGARAIALIAGLRSGDPVVLSHAGGDELHEPYRSAMSPETDMLMAAASAAGALHVCRSGSGPAALAFVTAATSAAVCAAMSDVVAATGGWARELDIDTTGVT